MSIISKLGLIICLGIIASIILYISNEDQSQNSVNLQILQQETQLRQDFNEILARFSKDYKTLDQFTTGLKNFRTNKALVDQMNLENDGVKFKLNKFFDIDMEDFKNKYLGRNKIDEVTQLKIKANSEALQSNRQLNINEINSNDRELWWFFDLFTKKTTTKSTTTTIKSTTTTKQTTSTTKTTTQTPVPTTSQTTTTKAPTSTSNPTTIVTSSSTKTTYTATSTTAQTTITIAPNSTNTSTTTPSPSDTTQSTTTTAPQLSTDFVGDTGYFDWRTAGKISAIKDQGDCGSCYAFSSMAALESLLLIKDYNTYQTIDLAEQQIVDCTVNYGNNGCNGGIELFVYDYTSKKGVADESKYPYVDKKQTCKSTVTGSIKTTSYKYISSNINATTIRSIVQKQPVSIGICASDIQFAYYSSGIFQNTSKYKCCTNINHALNIVGFGKQGTVAYWILKNSWGKSWGENGYMRIQMIENVKLQTCGIGYDLTYPII
ncbi:cysteine protease 1 [Stylonychia lemnae]|uniref:Cysteine protease 1 n=1 Tax=Stylonychia lemnae TaxID=5949 RepID=A0A078AST8_STYLE|nr:cysteine protease 1 [Stylonychia lemnae]|eukprot:CDW85086.1 cysteine protease 1 [Stylonychia lemnae]